MSTAYAPVEIAYRVPGKSWRRTVARTEAAFEKKIDRLIEQGAEIRTRPLS